MIRNKNKTIKRRAKKRYSSAKLTTYGYGLKVKTTLTQLETDNVFHKLLQKPTPRCLLYLLSPS